MGNAAYKNFTRTFRNWCLEQQRYKVYIPKNISIFMKYLLNHVEMYAMQPCENYTCFKKRYVHISTNCKPVVNHDLHRFVITYDTVKLTFNGMWCIELPFTYVVIVRKTKAIHQNLWYSERIPTRQQMLDMVKVQYGMISRRFGETSEDFDARLHLQLRRKLCHAPEMAREEKVTCKICFVHKPTECIVPCGHIICPTCNFDWKKNTCPFCRTKVERIVHMYN